MTIAGLQRPLLIGLPLLGALIVWYLWPAPVPPWAPLAGAVLGPLAAFLLLLTLEFVGAALLDPRSPRTSFLHGFRVWLRELWVSLRVFLWRQPWRSHFAEPALVHEPDRPAVLLIHGFMCNRAAWRPLLNSGQLSECNVATVNLTPIFGSIDSYADVVRDAVEALRRHTGAARVILVGHSMGGLAARVYLRKHGDAHVARVITLATPHQGTVFGRLAAARNARQMAEESQFLRYLHEDDRGRYAKFFCVGTRDDNLIVPRASALLPGAKQHLLDGVGHLALIEDPRAWSIVVDEIRAHAGSQAVRVAA